MLVYTQDAVPEEVLGAGRVAAAGEIRRLFQVVLPLLRPAIVTVLLLTSVAILNNFFLPLAVLWGLNLLPVTVGVYIWQALSNADAGGEQVWNLIVTGSFVSVFPLVVAFLAPPAVLAGRAVARERPVPAESAAGRAAPVQTSLTQPLAR